MYKKLKKQNILYIILIILALIILVTLFIIIKNNKVQVKLIGEGTITLNVSTPYKDEGVLVTEKGKEIKPDVIVDTDLDENKVGTYKYKYNFKYKNKEYNLERTIEVVDKKEPTLTTNIDEIERDYCTKKDKTELTYEASDNYDGDLTDKITKEETKDEIKLSIKDSSNNETTKSIKIKYTNMPNKKQELILKFGETVYTPLNSKYIEDGASLKDECGKVISSDAKITGSVDTSKIGEYELTYRINDYEKKRKVIVYEPSVDTNKILPTTKVLYLTFDDGPGVYTKKVLDTLKKYNVKATFFVTRQFPGYISLIKREHDEGHAVGVHTYTHKWNVYKSVDAYLNDFNKMNTVIESYTGTKASIFRFPGGSSNTISKNYSKGVVSAIASKMTSEGYTYFDWDVDSTDAGGGTKTQIYNRVVNGAAKCKTCVFLMHDIQYNTVSELDNILNALTKKGYKFGTLNTNSPTCKHKIAN